MNTLLFILFAAVTAAGGIGVVLFRNIVRAAVCLLFTLAGVAGLYFLLNAEFLAAVQLVVYTGGILILIIFGVMLTSTSAFSRFQPRFHEIVIGTVVAVILFIALTLVALGTPFPKSAVSVPTSIDTFGQSLLGDYVLPFELASVLLLVVMIGAVFLARGRRPRPASRGREPI